MMKDELADLLKQAERVQENMTKIQQKLEKTSVNGEAGAGLVKVHLTCKYEARRVWIDLQRLFTEEGVFKLLQDKSSDASEMVAAFSKSLEKCREMLEALVAAAFNDAARKIEAIVHKEVSNMTQNSPMPTAGMPTGFKPPI